jgi:repressor LexA
MIYKRSFLTKKQQETLDFIVNFMKRNGNAPTINEMREGLKLSSLRSVTQRLEGLERRGFIKRDRFQHRSITILQERDPSLPAGTVRIPLIAAVGADALKVYAQEQYNEYLTVDKDMVPDLRKEIVAVKVIGNSMVDAGLHNGDYVLVEIGEHPVNGDLVIANIGDMAVVKRLQLTPDTVILNPESKTGMYQPIFMNDTSKIWGKVLRTIRMRPEKEDLTYDYQISE